MWDEWFFYVFMVFGGEEEEEEVAPAPFALFGTPRFAC